MRASNTITRPYPLPGLTGGPWQLACVLLRVASDGGRGASAQAAAAGVAPDTTRRRCRSCLPPTTTTTPLLRAGFDYELHNRTDIEKALGDKAWCISFKDSACRCFGYMVSKKKYIYTIDDDCFV